MMDSSYSYGKFLSDLSAGLVVFLVALPLCLGVALASNAPLMSGILSGIVGGIVIGLLSGSHTSISGPSPGMTAIVSAQLLVFENNFGAFLLAVIIAGLMQICLGLLRAGFISAFFPSSVVKGLLLAIGVILILKQVHHVLGHDDDPPGDMAFEQPDHENTLSAFVTMVGELHPGAAILGVLSVALLLYWDRSEMLKKSRLPPPLVVVTLGVLLNWVFGSFSETLHIGASHLVSLEVAKSIGEFVGFLAHPDFLAWSNPAVYSAAMSIALVASLETLVNLAALDRIDPEQRRSPPNRELVAQGIGNCVLGLFGGIPASSAIVRGSVNITAGAKTKVAAIAHGILLAFCAILLPWALNKIPLSCLAAILVVTGIKLANPAMVKQMWDQGRYQFIPFVVTAVAILFTDLLKGIVIGMATSILFILSSNLRKPVRRVMEKHLGGEVLHIHFASQVSFLNRAALERILRNVPRGVHVLLDASTTDYIDPDVLDLIRDFKEKIAPAHGVQVSLRGFRSKYKLNDDIQFADYSTRELQDQLTTSQVVQILLEGNERFRTGNRLTRDLGRQIDATAKGQHPIAAVLSCIDSRTPAEIVLDLGLGDIFSVRIAGNVISENVLGSLEYSCAVAGAKVILVIGHTRCGAVTAAVDLLRSGLSPEQATGCQHLGRIVHQIQKSLDGPTAARVAQVTSDEMPSLVDEVARQNVLRTVREIVLQSQTISKLVAEGRIAVVGALYDLKSAKLDLLETEQTHIAPVLKQ